MNSTLHVHSIKSVSVNQRPAEVDGETYYTTDIKAISEDGAKFQITFFSDLSIEIENVD